VAEAYEVLRQQDLRAIFDQFGEEGLKKGLPQVFQKRIYLNLLLNLFHYRKNKFVLELFIINNLLK
jgi:DnaJ-class molecular chaperone